jgi:malic enzyme
MKTAAARAIADIVSLDELREEYIIPSVFNREVVGAVAAAVAEEARESGTAVAGAEVGFGKTEEFRIIPSRTMISPTTLGNRPNGSPTPRQPPRATE